MDEKQYKEYLETMKQIAVVYWNSFSYFMKENGNNTGLAARLTKDMFSILLNQSKQSNEEGKKVGLLENFFDMTNGGPVG